MIVKLNGRYIDTDSIEYISKVYLQSNTSPKTFAFYILLKNRIKEIVFAWDIKTYNGETDESLKQKIDAMRTKLAKKMNDNIENLDVVIDLRKEDTSIKSRPMKMAAKKAAR
jgi:hypothetical protein